MILFWTKIINAFNALPPFQIANFVLHNKDVNFVKIILFLQEEIQMPVKLVQRLINNVNLVKKENVLDVTKDSF